ncbi:MAG: hypothetical protein NVV72_07920 [Asticcacaulis sp.]|nr:hypothetical protein [Asticcacaulis sp.]
MRVILMHELAVAVTAFGCAVLAQFVIGQGVAQRAAATVAGDLVAVDIDDFGGGIMSLMMLNNLAEKPLPILKTNRLVSSIEL